MINDWRAQFNLNSNNQTSLTFPFGFVILSTYQDTANVTCGNGNPATQCPWAMVRWSQYAAYFKVRIMNYASVNILNHLGI